MEMLTSQPRIGSSVGVVLHHKGKHHIIRKATVVKMADHDPVDGARDREALAILSDGTEEFWWNLTPLDPKPDLAFYRNADGSLTIETR